MQSLGFVEKQSIDDAEKKDAKVRKFISECLFTALFSGEILLG